MVPYCLGQPARIGTIEKVIWLLVLPDRISLNNRSWSINLTFLVVLVGISLPPGLAAAHKNEVVPAEYTPSLSDVHSQTLSADAVQLAQQLHIADKLREVVAVKKQRLANAPVPAEQLERYRDYKDDIIEAIEQSRLEIDFTQAELSREEAVYSELLAAYIYDKDRRVDLANAWGYRTNGVLWAVAEALSIPTYTRPRYAISAGTIGIVAGLVPSAFSLYALRAGGGGKFDRKAHTNMLAKVFGYPVTCEIDYPDSLWTWLNSVPPVDAKQSTRLELMKNWWQRDENLRTFVGKNSRVDLGELTGTTQHRLTIQLVSDRLSMVRHMRALTLQMERPLLELMMAVRGLKSFD